MSKKYAKKTSRSRRNRKDLRGEISGLDPAGRTVQLSLPVGEILEGMQGAFEEVSQTVGLLIMKALIDDEVAQLAGEEGKHGSSSVRWGQEESHLVLNGKKHAYRRPRVRRRSGKEVSLERVKLFQRPALMEETVAKQVVLGVSMRDYEKAVDGVCDGYGIRKSSVSRHWKVVSSDRLAEFVERSFEDLDLVALVIDGIEFHGTLLIVALGVDSTGKKHILGQWQGATESFETSEGFLEDLVRRGVDPERRYLFVLDGSKGLLKAVRRVFGKNAEIQRCQAHYADFRIMPTSVLRLRWWAETVVEGSA